MTAGSRRNITFARLPTVAQDEILAHMNDPRVARHMPLLVSRWDRRDVADFVAAKEARWRRDGLGHWAILLDGSYVGWGGFEMDGDAWDFGLVLRPDSFGLGARIIRQAIAFARADARIDAVTFLVPPSRRHLGGLARIGARFAGDVEHEGARFLKYRLETR